ncbi:MAG TPA: tetratricopeptide repeat protein, partial [Thermoanaerobaculia bacterium]
MPRLLLPLGLAALLATGAAWAEDGILVVHVNYLDKKPLPRVRIGTTGDGSIEVTDMAGRARIRLAPGVKAGQEVALQIVPGENDKDSWVFINPWDQRALVPPFEGGGSVSVILAKKADKDALLGSSEGRKAIERKILSELSKLQQAKSEITEEQRRTVLQAQAAAYGLKPEEVDAAIRAASQKSPDLYEQGLAALYEKNYPVASERLQEALAASEKELAQTQEKVGDRAFFLGQSLYQQGRYSESVTAFKRAAELRGEHAEALNWLGLALEGAGNYPEAGAVLNRALTANQRSNSNLGTFIQGNLALVLYDRGDLTGARRLGEQVLESRRRQLGADHPATLMTMGNLAETLRAQGDLPKARQLQEQVLESRRRQLGADHPDTLTAMNNLALTLDAQGDLVTGRSLQEQVLQARRRLLGPKNPDTSLIEWNLLVTLRALGDQRGAREFEKSLAWLLTAPEAELSTQQREIRQDLKEIQGDEKNHSLTPPASSAPNSQTPAPPPPSRLAPLATARRALNDP